MVVRTYGKIKRGDGAWWIGELEPHVAIRFKAVFPGVPKGSPGPFRLPDLPQTAADVAWFVSRYPLAGEPADLLALEDGRRGFEALQAEVGRIMSADYQPPIFAGLRDGQAARTHQAQAVDLLSRFEGLLCGDEGGEGKTYTGGLACLLPGALPATVVCPAHLRRQWARKLEEFTTLTTHVVRQGTPYDLPPCDVRIFSYGMVGGWADYLEGMGTGLVIFDEVHGLRRGEFAGGDEVIKGMACGRLSRAARFRLGLTGTPIFNYGDEIWRVMQFLRPDVLGEWEDFQREWCKGGREVKDPEALGAYLREQHAMVRKLSSGPKANILVETVDHDAWRLDGVEAMAMALAKMATQATDFRDRGRATRELDLLLRQETGIAKAEAVAAYCRILLEAGEPIVLFGWHRAVYDVWVEALKDFNPVLYTGSESEVQKEANKRAFIAGESDVMIISLRSGEGLDGIQARCRTAVIGELDWSPATHAQCIWRINRDGQPCWPEPVNAIFLVADDGSDPPMQDVVGLKASQAQGIVDPGLGVQAVIRDESRVRRLVERYLHRDRRAAA